MVACVWDAGACVGDAGGVKYDSSSDSAGNGGIEGGGISSNAVLVACVGCTGACVGVGDQRRKRIRGAVLSVGVGKT